MDNKNILTKKQDFLLSIQGYLMGILPSFSMFQIFYGKNSFIFYADIFLSIIFIVSSVVNHHILKDIYHKINQNPQLVENHQNIVKKYSKKQKPYIAFTLFTILILIGLLLIFYGKIYDIYSMIIIGLFLGFYGLLFSKKSFLFYKQPYKSL